MVAKTPVLTYANHDDIKMEIENVKFMGKNEVFFSSLHHQLIS
jgi:hypothetical protein